MIPLPSSKLSKTLQLGLEQSHADALFYSIGEGAITTDEDGKIQQVNQLALDLLGYKKSEVVGKWFPRIIVATDENNEPIDPLDRPITQAMLAGKPITEKAYYRTKSGGSFPVSITVSPVIFNGRPVGAIEVFQDITHEHEIDRMKSEFISIASHQLRTPLTAIKTYSHLLASGFKGDLTPEQKEFMEIVLSSIDRMNELINTLLDVSVMETGKMELRPQVMDLKALVVAIIEDFSHLSVVKGINVELVCDNKEITVNLDPLLTREIYSNLISNAIKYTPAKGAVKVHLKDRGRSVWSSVEDNGYGIPADVQDKVFSKFFRADNAKIKEPSGTGLGLYMVKQIIENMGGDVNFTSEENVGTKISFTLPK